MFCGESPAFTMVNDDGSVRTRSSSTGLCRVQEPCDKFCPVAATQVSRSRARETQAYALPLLVCRPRCTVAYAFIHALAYARGPNQGLFLLECVFSMIAMGGCVPRVKSV